MRTRAQSIASPPPSSPPAPAYTRRKRTAKTQESADDDDEQPVTPQRQTKRVRFSDATENFSSSGLTPALNRSTLHRIPLQSSSESKFGSTKQSLLPTPDSSPLLSVQELHFTPLKQVLDDRLKRRLRRSHLSEEINEFEHEHRAEAKVRRQISDRLRDQVVEKERRIGELMLELEEQRLRGIEVFEEDQKKNDLELELINLKEQLAREHADAELDTHLMNDVGAPDDGEFSDADSIWDDNLVSSQMQHHRLTKSPSFVVNQPVTADASIQVSIQNEQNEAKIAELEHLMIQLTKDGDDARAALQIIREELLTLGFSTDRSDAADTIISTIREALRQARLDLEYILPGETISGLASGKTLLDSLIYHVKTLLSKAKTSQQAFEVQQQSQSSLRRQFNTSLETIANLKETMLQKQADHDRTISGILANRTELITKVEEKHQELESLRDSTKSLQSQAASDAKRMEDLGRSLRESEDENETSIARLNAALDRYREDVASLEELTRTLEQEKQTLEKRLDQANAALSSAEDSARKTAESSASDAQAHAEAVATLRNTLETTKAELESTVLDHEVAKAAAAAEMSEAAERVEEIEKWAEGRKTRIRELEKAVRDLEREVEERQGVERRFKEDVRGVLERAVRRIVREMDAGLGRGLKGVELVEEGE